MTDFASRCVNPPAIDVAADTPPAAPPLYATSVFHASSLDAVERSETGADGWYSYSRIANPTVAAFEAAVADLEGAAAAVAAASGMGALAATLLALAQPGARIVAVGGLYGTTVSLIQRLTALGMDTVPVAAGDAIPPARVVLVETITNPLLDVADLRALAAAAHEAGAVLVVDNTFATPYHCRPLDLGADLVVHSATKFLGGHSDLMAGVVAGREELVAGVRAALTVFGATPAPHSVWLALRGMRTLALRMERQSANAALIAARLAEMPAVRRVSYPGLPGHPSHDVARRTLERGFGALVSFELADRAAVDTLFHRLKLIRYTASLGDVASTWSHPASASHRGLTPEERAAAGIGPGLVRLSVGAEGVADLMADLEVGLQP